MEKNFTRSNPWAERLLKPIRRISCPRPGAIAAFADRTLDSRAEQRLRTHIEKCRACSQVVEQLEQMSRSPLPEVPPSLLRQAKEMGARRKTAWGLTPGWQMAGSFAAVCMVLLLGVWFGALEGQPEVQPEEIRTVRGEDSGAVVPLFVSPVQDSVLRGQGLQLQWTEVPDALSYEVNLLDAEGGLVESFSTGKALTVSPRSELPPGIYFVSVTANLKDGRSVKGGFNRFTVQDSR